MTEKLLNLPFPLITTVLLLFFTLSIFIKTDSSFDQDLGRHLKLGQIILESKQIPTTNLFSYTHPDFPFINHHWLFEILAYLGDKALGTDGLLILKLMVVLLTVWISLKTSNTTSLLTLPVAFIFLHLLRERTDLRPEIFSFLFTALGLYLLEKFDQGNKRALLPLPLIQLVWINIHIYFLIGFVLQGVYLVHYLFSKKYTQAKLLLGCLLVSLLVSLLNPNFISGLIYPLTIFGNYGYSIVENQTIFFLESINFQNPNFLFYKLSAGIILLTLLLAGIRRSLSLKAVLLISTGLVLASIHVRSLPYLVLISLPILTKLLPSGRSQVLMLLIHLLTAGILLQQSLNYLNGSYYLSSNSPNQAKLEAPQHGKGAMDFLLANNLPQPIYNNFDIGSYIIYRGYPEFKVFVDGRPEAYPDQFFQAEYIPSQADPEVFAQLSQKYQFKTIIFSHTDQTPWAQTFLTNIVGNPSWQVIYLDETMIILTLSETVKEHQLQPLDLQTLEPGSYHFASYIPYLRLAIFFDRIGQTETSSKFLQVARRLNPEL